MFFMNFARGMHHALYFTQIICKIFDAKYFTQIMILIKLPQRVITGLGGKGIPGPFL